MRVAVIGPETGLVAEIADRLENRDHLIVEPEDDAEVVVDADEPGSRLIRPDDRAWQVSELLALARPARYVLISSVLVYAPVPDPARWPIREHNPRRAHGDPSSRAYGQACITAEDVLIEQTGDRTEYVVLRPTMITGSRPDGFADRLLDAVTRQPWATADRYDGVGTMQWVDVTDAAAAVVAAVESSAAAGEIFTIAGAEAFTAADLASLVTGELVDPAEFTDRPKFGTIKARTMLGWRPRTRITPTEPDRADPPARDGDSGDRRATDRRPTDRRATDRRTTDRRATDGPAPDRPFPELPAPGLQAPYQRAPFARAPYWAPYRWAGAGRGPWAPRWAGAAVPPGRRRFGAGLRW